MSRLCADREGVKKALAQIGLPDDLADRLEAPRARTRGSAARRVLAALETAGFAPTVEWWTSPVGVAVARALPADTDVRWSNAVAAAWLGVRPTTMGSLKKKYGLAMVEPYRGYLPADVIAYYDNRRKAEQ